MNRLNKPDVNIITVEDPIEYNLDGIGQTQVNPRIDMNFARALRAILRQDPDIIMIGEIRDFETTEIGVKAALTGHLVLSTLHTNDAPSAVTRLIEMGIEPFLVGSSLDCVMAQRLARRLAALEAHGHVRDRSDGLLLPPDDEPLADPIDDEGGRAGGPDIGWTGCGADLQFGTQGGCHGVTPGDRGGVVGEVR